MGIMTKLEKLKFQNGNYSDIASYIIENTDSIVNLSITDFSKLMHVSTATVSRFCKTLGFVGYKEFLFEIKNACKLNKNEKVLNFDQNHWFYENLKIKEKNLFENTDTLIDQLQCNLEQLKDIFDWTNKINLFGLGDNIIAQKYFYNLFSPLDWKISFSSDLDTNKYFLKENNLVNNLTIVFSYTLNSSVYLEDVITFANKNNHKLICITGNPNSDLLKFFDLVFIAKNNESETLNRINFLSTEIFFVNAMFTIAAYSKNLH